MTNPAKCHCGSISWEHRYGENRYVCASCKRPLWQPIETAPKDGEWVLVHGFWYPRGDYRGTTLGAYLPDEGMWTFEGDLMDRPTHWMLLPEPPRHE
jgi:hypothetical protein